MTRSKRWLIPPVLTAEANAALAPYPPLLRQVLFNRGYGSYQEAQAFLNARPNFDSDPFQMTGMAASVERIRRALAEGQPIAIYGDYDVDGVTATALLVEALQALGASVRGYIPNRFDEGYGLNKEALDHLKADGVELVITVDCGIRSPDEARHARDIGLDLIISDHHHPAEGDLPPALAVINPKQRGDPYPDKDLAGVGIAYKLAEALAGDRNAPLLNGLLDLVALGTVADLAPLVGENRSLVRRGLRQMRETQRQGLFSLAGVAGIDLRKVNAGNIGYGLGPRLNASGRLESALASFELLTTRDLLEAGRLSQQLNQQNMERQRITREMQIKAEEIALEKAEGRQYLLFAAHEGFNSGVIGLAASRLTEKYYLPSIVAARGPEETRGSCRSIPEFHITDALDRCTDLLVRHGGHAAAAGFTVRNENLPPLVERLTSIAREKLDGQDLRPTLTADAEVPLSQIRPELIGLLSELEPTGYGNRESAFVSRRVKVKNGRVVGADGKHLKLWLDDDKGFTHDAIGFNLGEWIKEMPPRVDILFTYEVNEYNGRTGYQLNLKDMKASGAAE
ncbi:MAG: single-stranded-DNA-specific exonuclease RecJ [Chloroflexota bacterium]